MKNPMERQLERRLTERVMATRFTDQLEIAASDARYPARLHERLGVAAPATLAMLGNPALLALPTTALFCSSNCPASLLLPTFDLATHWRDAGRCVISGFHSPVEKECLKILLRGQQPLIYGLARSLSGLRIPQSLKNSLDAGRLLILSPFLTGDKRLTRELAMSRNRLLAALADDLHFAWVTPGGNLNQLKESW